MRKETLVRAIGQPWLRGPAWHDDSLIFMDCARTEAYQPLLHPKIGLELTRVKTPADAVAFVTRYGLLRSSSVPTTLGKPYSPYEPFLDFLKAGDKLRVIITVACDVRRAVKGDALALTRLQKNFDGPEYNQREPRSILTRAGEWAATELRKGLGHASTYIYDRAYVGEAVEPGQFRIGILPETLLEVCYLQIALALTEKEPLETCQECERGFLAEDARQRFCSPQCASRARFRRFKNNQTVKTTPKKKGSRHGKTTRTRGR